MADISGMLMRELEQARASFMRGAQYETAAVFHPDTVRGVRKALRIMAMREAQTMIELLVLDIVIDKLSDPQVMELFASLLH